MALESIQSSCRHLACHFEHRPGSPTGARFGYGAQFPKNYQEAFYVLDWSWGKIYAVHLEEDGSSYRATKEEFITGAPFP